MTEVGPFTSMTDAARELRRPFTSEATRWKLQNLLGVKKGSDGKPDPSTAKGGLIVAYIDARLVIERLNLLCPEWTDHYEGTDREMRCDLTVCGRTRSGYGIGKDRKASESDSLKRAAVKFGVGVSLYALQQVTLWRAAENEPAGNKLRPNWKGHLELDEHNRKWLAEQYARWLASDRGQHFGEPLDHGDSFGAVGDPEDPDSEAPEPAPDPEQTAELERLRAEVEVAYVQLDASGRKRLPPGKYRARLEAASDVESLSALLGEIRALPVERVAA